MLCRAARCAIDVAVDAFEWAGASDPMPPDGAMPSDAPAPLVTSAETIVDDTRRDPQPAPDFGALEREAFTKGYAQGERAGTEAAAARGEAMLRRLARTIDELAVLRSDMLQKTERQLVQLAVAIARRITLRELTIDRSLLSAMARVALDRLGETASATIRLHPDDYAAIATPGGLDAMSGAVRIVADRAIAPGGCIVQSDFGLIDVGLDAQLTELSVALLGDGGAGLEEATDAAA
jgi:flagellar assembly protein FliH